MPKNEVDPEDPMELHGVALFTEEETNEVMAECFIEEFMRMGHGADHILALFRNPHYTGVHMVWENRGEPFIREKIVEVFGWWKQPVNFAETPKAEARPSPEAPAEGGGEGRSAANEGQGDTVIVNPNEQFNQHRSVQP